MEFMHLCVHVSVCPYLVYVRKCVHILVTNSIGYTIQGKIIFSMCRSTGMCHVVKDPVVSLCFD